MKRLSISLIALLAAGPSLAQTTDIELDEIVVTANRESTRIGESGASVTVVTAKDLLTSGESGISGYFRRIAGMTVNTRGTVGTQAGVLVRGASQNYLGATIDGIDVTDPSNTQIAFDFGQLTTAGIGRIEVLKGSQSALYGAGAVGGLIAIETLRPTEDGLNQTVSAEVGSNRTASASYALTFRDDTTDFATTLSHYQTDGFSNADEADGNTEADGFRNDRLSFYVARRLDSGLTLGLNGFAEKSRSEYDPAFYLPAGAVGPVLTSAVIPLGDGSTPDEALSRRTFALRTFGQLSTGAVDHSFALSTFRTERSYHESELSADYSSFDDQGNGDPSDDTVGVMMLETDATYIGTRHKAEYTSAFDAFSGRVVLGGDVVYEALDQFGDFGASDNSTNRVGAFGEYRLELQNGGDISFSARVDNHSLFGLLPTARVAYVQPVTADTLLRVQAGTGYRAPSNFELYSDYGAQSLDAENSSNFDIGLEHDLGGGNTVRATAFYLAVDNLIDFDFASTICPISAIFGPGCYNQVDGTSIRRGLELEGEFAVGSDTAVTVAYTFTDSATNASSAWAQIPDHQIALGLETALSDSMTGRIDLFGAVGRPDWTDGTPARDYAVINASVAYGLNNGTEAYLRIENLLDEKYQLVQDYGTSRRALYAGIRASF